MKIVVGMNGTTGVVYGIRLLQALSDMEGIETHLIISRACERTIELETDCSIEDIRSYASYTHPIEDIAACLASGSFQHDGMIVAPCSMKTLSAVANAYSDNLLTRAADVTLKERRRLLLLVRETPLHLGHLKNMVRVTEMGGIVMPPVPAFYHQPRTIQDIVDHTVGKILDIFRIEHTLYRRWSGADE